MVEKPKIQNSDSAKALDQAQKQFETFDQQVKDLTQDRMNLAPKVDVEPQTKLASVEIAKKPELYLKPDKTISSPEKFNENYREAYDFDKEYVQFIAEHKELIGETIELWTKPYAGVPAMFWKVPTNKPVWGPRYLAEQIRRKTYHRLITQQNSIVGSDGAGTFYGQMVADTTIPRLTAEPVSTRKSVFMGAVNF